MYSKIKDLLKRIDRRFEAKDKGKKTRKGKIQRIFYSNLNFNSTKDLRLLGRRGVFQFFLLLFFEVQTSGVPGQTERLGTDHSSGEEERAERKERREKFTH